MYWTDWNRNAPKIEVANMDGTGRKDLVTDNLALPNMVVIDFDRNNLCWTDSGLKLKISFLLSQINNLKLF